MPNFSRTEARTASESSDNIRSRGTTRIHQYQRLPIVHRSRPQRFTFPATPVYHPGSRYLYPAGIHIYSGACPDIPVARTPNCRRGTIGVHKKTTRIAQHLRIGQFALTDVYSNHPAQSFQINSTGYFSSSCRIVP